MLAKFAAKVQSAWSWKLEFLNVNASKELQDLSAKVSYVVAVLNFRVKVSNSLRLESCPEWF